jgi:hypothetical protein
VWDLLNNPLTKKIVGSFVRKALAGLSGFLVAEGYLEQADVAAFITALAPIAISAIWSILEKRKSEREIKTALTLPPDTPRETVSALAKS